MPKQIYKIVEFHGGLNSNSEGRDIADNELSDAIDISVDKVGKVAMLGGIDTHSTVQAKANDITGGYGLFAFSHDRDDGHTAGSGALVGESHYLAFSDSDAEGTISIYSHYADTWGDPITGFTDGTPGRRDNFYYVDGELRIADGYLPANVNQTRWYGYINRHFFGNGSIGYDAYSGSNNGHEVSTWHLSNAHLEELTLSDVDKSSSSSGSTVFHIDIPTIAAPIGVQLKWTNNANTYTNANQAYTHADWAIKSDTLTIRTVCTITAAGDDLTATTAYSFPADPGYATFCSEGDKIWIQDASGTTNNLMATVTSVTANTASPHVITFAEALADETNGIYYLHNISRSNWFDTIIDGVTIGVSTLYDDNKQESPIANAGGTLATAALMSHGGADQVNGMGGFENLGFYFCVFAGDASNDGVPIASPRVSGWRLYLKPSNSSTYYLYGEIDVTRGARQVDSDSYSMWEAAVPGGTMGAEIAYCEIDVRSLPTTLLTYEDMTGFKLLTELGQDTIGFAPVGSNKGAFATAVVANRRAYAGNVKIQNEFGKMEIRNDAILKSPVNKFDSFRIENRLEASVNDGDEIIKLEEYADRLLEFKRKKMTLINISQDIEFLEDTFIQKGVSHPAAVCKTDFGVAWVNEHGCYLYDGQRVSNLLEKGGRKIIKESTWAAFVYRPMIGYIPKKRQLLVAQDVADAGNGSIYLYDMVTKSWIKGGAGSITDHYKTNFVIDWNNDLIYAHTTDQGTVVKWDDAADTSTSMSMITKDIDFGQPGQKKTVYKVIVTYQSGNATTNVQLDYGVNGDTTFAYDFTVPELPAADGWQVAELVPDTLSEASNIRSFRLRFATDGTVPAAFEINDISIVYRLKGAR